jgi:hypothetical protein
MQIELRPAIVENLSFIHEVTETSMRGYVVVTRAMPQRVFMEYRITNQRNAARGS